MKVDDILNTEIANSLFGYLETLYNANKNLIKLCGELNFYKYECVDKIILDIIREIPRLIPYEYDRNKEKNILAKTDGLLEYRKEIPYLYSKYLSLINKHDPLLNDIRRIRNKYTHIIHGVKVLSHYSSMLINGFEFKIKGGDSVRISVGSLIILFTDLNEIFSQLVYDAVAWRTNKAKVVMYITKEWGELILMTLTKYTIALY